MNILEVIHKRNQKMIIVIWFGLISFTILNFFDTGTTFHAIVWFGYPIAIIPTILCWNKKSITFTMYTITAYSLVLLALVNYMDHHYVNYIFLFLPLLLSALYPDVRNFLFSYVGSSVSIVYFSYKYGHEYFVLWESYYSIHLVILTTLMALITFYSSQLSEKLRLDAEKKANKAKKETEKAKALTRETIQYLAYNDPLTGLPNRNAFLKQFKDRIKNNQNENNHIALLYFDLDNFKRINDTLGHHVGDDLLKEIVNRLSANCQEGTIYRLGGDEFGWVIDLGQDLLVAEQSARKLLSLFQTSTQLGTMNIYISPSVGISIYPIDGTTAEQLLKQADMAMYRAKENGKNTYAFYNAQMSSDQEQQFYLEADLRKAIKNDEFVLHYQPIVESKTFKLKGFEVLLRWEHPDYQVVPPHRFIPLAEETNLILPMGEWVLRNACLQAKVWQDTYQTSVTVAVNLSIKQFLQNDLADQIKQILKETKLSPELLELEITESMTMNAMHTQEVLKELKQIGVKVAIDDFGTGYSSFAYLKKFSVDQLKIDRSFIRDMESGDTDLAIVRTIVSMAKHLQLEVVAEGVEEINQLHELQKMDCDFIQGYYFSKPVPPNEAEQFIKSQMKFGKVIEG
ncbi:putative bifunctional diguanylate cyclase/phosphodiesterase [Bacillus salitolerans]|uniref:Bifunctional diguanylate cyclase/phosphodiesterase n=1 Tax=Bacillus salitolerans TaxID=1437434 RepID=A0ABW4LUY4_9BACI